MRPKNALNISISKQHQTVRNCAAIISTEEHKLPVCAFILTHLFAQFNLISGFLFLHILSCLTERRAGGAVAVPTSGSVLKGEIGQLFRLPKT